MKKIIFTTISLFSFFIFFEIYSKIKINQKIEKGLLVEKPFGKPIQKEPSAIPNEWFGIQRTWPHGKFDETFYYDILEEVHQKRIQNSNSLIRNNWELIGPTNIGGRITDLAIHEDFPETIYVGAATGGIFKSTDNGESWVHLFKDSPVISIGDLAIDPNNPNIIYAGTGEANSSSFSFPGNGIYKSYDAGQNWQHKGLTESSYFGRIIVDYSNPERIFTASCGSLFTPGPHRGIYRSQNGGEDWDKILFITDSTSAIDLVQHPLNPDILYASMWERIRGLNYRRSGGPSSGIYKTVDGGNNWEELVNGLPQDEFVGRIGIDISLSNPNIIYAFYDKQMTEDEENSFYGIYKSENNGQSWTRTNDFGLEQINRSFGWYFGQIRIDPENENNVYALGVEMAKTINGGDSWEIISGYWNADEIHVDQHSMLFQSELNKIWVGNDGGLYSTTDEGNSWIHYNNIPLTQFYKIEINPSNPNNVAGGTQDNGSIQTFSEINNWNKILGGDGFHVEIHPVNPNIIYAEYQWGQLKKTVDGGNNWASIGSEFRDDRTNWSTPFQLDRFNPEIIYIGTYRLWKSEDGGSSFYNISEDLTDGDNGSSYHTITTFNQSSINHNYLIAGTDDGNIHISTSEGDWVNISDGLPKRWITSVSFDNIDLNTIYCTISGFRWDEEESHIYKSNDLGQNWESISGDLPEIPINCLVINPENNMKILVGTDAGVFETNNGGINWRIFGNNLPAVPITDVVFHQDSNILVVGTYGCSAFKINWNSFVLGDVTMDGVINVTDIIQIINFILDNDTPSENELEIGDINYDGILNVLDIIEIINLILN